MSKRIIMVTANKSWMGQITEGKTYQRIKSYWCDFSGEGVYYIECDDGVKRPVPDVHFNDLVSQNPRTAIKG